MLWDQADDATWDGTAPLAGSLCHVWLWCGRGGSVGTSGLSTVYSLQQSTRNGVTNLGSLGDVELVCNEAVQCRGSSHNATTH